MNRLAGFGAHLTWVCRYSAGFVVFLAACAKQDVPDAYGNFEASEVVVSAEAAGQLLRFDVTDGSRLVRGQVVGVIDTVQLALDREQLAAARLASETRSIEASQHIEAIKIQLEIAERNRDRIRRLYAQNAATAVQLDQAETEFKLLEKQIDAARSQLKTLRQDVAISDVRSAQLRERFHKSNIVNPLEGVVLTSYSEEGEFVQPGQPLYKIANLDSMDLRVYITEVQLAAIQIGTEAVVSLDFGKGETRNLSGVVTWISNESEFTPTPIQTREERRGLVYAVKLRVANENGWAKIGMPADVRFKVADTANTGNSLRQ